MNRALSKDLSSSNTDIHVFHRESLTADMNLREILHLYVSSDTGDIGDTVVIKHYNANLSVYRLDGSDLETKCTRRMN